MTVRLMWLSNALLVAGCAGEAAPAASPSSPPQPSSSPSAHVDPAPASPTPVEGFPVRYHALSAEVSLPGACLLYSSIGDTEPRCPKQAASPGVGALSGWTSTNARGMIFFIFQESLEEAPSTPALPASLTDKAIDATVRGVNDRSATQGLSVARVRAKERRAPMPDGGQRFMTILAPTNEPTTRAGKAMAHQAIVKIPTKRALYAFLWFASAERADEIEAMARKTFESVRFEEP